MTSSYHHLCRSLVNLSIWLCLECNLGIELKGGALPQPPWLFCFGSSKWATEKNLGLKIQNSSLIISLSLPSFDEEEGVSDRERSIYQKQLCDGWTIWPDQEVGMTWRRQIIILNRAGDDFALPDNQIYACVKIIFEPGSVFQQVHPFLGCLKNDKRASHWIWCPVAVGKLKTLISKLKEEFSFQTTQRNLSLACEKVQIASEDENKT